MFNECVDYGCKYNFKSGGEYGWVNVRIDIDYNNVLFLLFIWLVCLEIGGRFVSSLLFVIWVLFDGS